MFADIVMSLGASIFVLACADVFLSSHQKDWISDVMTRFWFRLDVIRETLLNFFRACDPYSTFSRTTERGLRTTKERAAYLSVGFLLAMPVGFLVFVLFFCLLAVAAIMTEAPKASQPTSFPSLRGAGRGPSMKSRSSLARWSDLVSLGLI
jgi:hypothetical protein